MKDNFLQKIFTTLIQENTEYLNYIKDETGEEYKEIKDDLVETIELINDLKENVKSEKDFIELDDDQIDFLYECLATYESIFIMDYRNKKILAQQQKEYSKLESYLDLFNFEGDEEDEEEFEEE